MKLFLNKQSKHCYLGLNWWASEPTLHDKLNKPVYVTLNLIQGLSIWLKSNAKMSIFKINIDRFWIARKFCARFTLTNYFNSKSSKSLGSTCRTSAIIFNFDNVISVRAVSTIAIIEREIPLVARKSSCFICFSSLILLN